LKEDVLATFEELYLNLPEMFMEVQKKRLIKEGRCPGEDGNDLTDHIAASVV
jgi:hypothetical protein